MHIGDISAVKMVVMARPLLNLCWAGTRLKKHFMKFGRFHNERPYVVILNLW